MAASYPDQFGIPPSSSFDDGSFRSHQPKSPKRRSQDIGDSLSANGLDSYNFSKDFLPKRYDRFSQSDLPLKIITFVQIGFNIFMAYFFITFQVSLFIPVKSAFAGVHLALMSFFFIFTMFWLNYKVNHFLLAIYRLLMDLDVIKRNDKYYSGLEIPDFYVASVAYPHVTIQVPVYKESLQNTIRPTLQHCVREARRYMEETGAPCNVIICDDGYSVLPEAEREARIALYKEHEVSFTARPHPSKLPRKGRFKKASNLNFSMNFSEVIMQAVNVKDGIEQTNLNALIDLGTEYGGDIFYGDFILLIDSDTRLPELPDEENGCLKRLAKEMMFDGDDVLFIQCFTGPYMSVKSMAEKGIFHHTCNIYNSILMATAIHSMAPLVGHNAFLNKKAMTECARDDETQPGYKLYWAEDRISEDFDMMMRGCEKGYIGRYAAHAGVFLEGVSFSYLSEYFKIAKFGCGAAELIYNPITTWYSRGILSPNLIGFIKSSQVEWYNKMFIVAYIFNFVALATAHWGLLYNLIFCEQLYALLPTALLPINLMWESIFVWTILGAVCNYLFGLRLGFEQYLLLKQVLREGAFLTCLYGSISVKMSVICLCHLFNLDLSFGATQKDDRRVSMVDWIKSAPVECVVYTLYLAGMATRLYVFTHPDKYQFVIYYGCVPLLWMISLFWLGPLCFDVLPRKVDKTGQISYNLHDRMFSDKYHMQVPNSKMVKSIKVGSNVKMEAQCVEDEFRYDGLNDADSNFDMESGGHRAKSTFNTRSTVRSLGLGLDIDDLEEDSSLRDPDPGPGPVPAPRQVPIRPGWVSPELKHGDLYACEVTIEQKMHDNELPRGLLLGQRLGLPVAKSGPTLNVQR